MSSEAKFLFVVDTDSYSGNFEREMTAFMVGMVGECGVGSDFADDCEAEVIERSQEELLARLQDKMIQEPDEHGVFRPCVIYPTPGRKNDGKGEHSDLTPAEAASGVHYYPAYESVALFMEHQPTAEELDLMKTRAHQFVAQHESPIKITGFRLIEQHRTITTTSWPV